jgi:DNA repair protein SbcD/Mre11
MLRVVHTSDWHLGQELAGWSRAVEHRDFFDQLEALLTEREIDALIVAGDVFDHQNPSSAAQSAFYGALARFRRARPELTTVVIAGNHDAAGRIEAPRALLDAFGVHVVGSVRRRDGALCPDTHAVPLKTARGEIAAWTSALPFLRPVDLPPLRRDGEDSPIVEAVRSLYAEAAEAVAARAGGDPLILTGHLHVAGGLESEGAERRILVGGEHAVPPDIFPEAAAYVALGHLHRPQMVGRETVRYSGAPFAMSATERNYRHGVSVLEIDGAVRLEHVAFRRRTPFIRVPDEGAVAADAAGDALKAAVDALGVPLDAPVHERPFVQLVVRGDSARSNLRAELDRLSEALPIRIVSVRTERERTPIDIPTPARRLADLDPETVFAEAFARAHGARPEPPHLSVFHAALASED